MIAIRSRIALAAAFVGLLTASGCTPRPAQTRASDVSVAVPRSNSVSIALFQNVATPAGITFTHTNGDVGRHYFVESTPAGCAFLDYNGDGFLDVLMVQSGSSEPGGKGVRPHCTLYRNNGDGTFTDVTVGSGFDKDLGYAHGVAVGDYDNDGFDDVLITSYGHNFLFHNEHGSGKFVDVTHRMGLDKTHSTGYATSAAFGDYDNDGKLDLYICYYCPWTWMLDRPCKDPQDRSDYCSPEIYPPDVHQLLHNDGDHFTDVTIKAGISASRGRGLAVAFLDYDGDGLQDIFVANDLTPNMLWHNNGDGTFTNKAIQAGCAYGEGGQIMAAMGVGVSDYDRSGRPSLFVSNFSGLPNTLFHNLGGGIFRDMSVPAGIAFPHMKYLTFGCEFLDYDNDGWPDLITANGHVQIHADTKLDGVTYRERKQLFHNDSGGKFREVTDPAQLGDLGEPVVSRGLASGDYDNDGGVDILVNNQNGAAQLLHNQRRDSNHWIAFKPVGTRSNRDGYHALFKVTAGGAVQTADVRAGSSYLSHSDTRVHFGLGSAARVEKVEIRWPSGTKETLKNLTAGSIYVVKEGQGVIGKLRAGVRP